MASFYNEEQYFNVGFNKLLGLHLVEAEHGQAIITMTVQPEYLNPAGLVHGGVLFALADSAGANAAVSYGNQVVTVNSEIKYMRPALGSTKTLTGTAREIKHGKTISFYEVSITADDDTEVARVSLTYFTKQS
jgi:acyl-CoA thioesterase